VFKTEKVRSILNNEVLIGLLSFLKGIASLEKQRSIVGLNIHGRLID
jgi:hypothetical protein